MMDKIKDKVHKIYLCILLHIRIIAFKVQKFLSYTCIIIFDAAFILSSILHPLNNGDDDEKQEDTKEDEDNDQDNKINIYVDVNHLL